MSIQFSGLHRQTSLLTAGPERRIKNQLGRMTPRQAIQLVREKFPLKGYAESHVEACHNIAITALRYLSPGARVLDFGCGPCDKTAVIQCLGFECFGYDDLKDAWHELAGTRQEILAFIEEFGIRFTLAKDDRLPFEKDSFQMVMMHDVLEHLHDSPREIVNDLLELVVPRGYFFATVPSAVNIRKRVAVLFGNTNLPPFSEYYWSPGFWRGHVREYTKNDLVKLASYLDLEIVEIRGCNHMLEKVPTGFRTLYLAVTKVFTGWRDSWMLVARKPLGWKPRRTLPPEEWARAHSARSR